MAALEVGFACAVFDLDFHPTADLLAVGLVDGSLELLSHAGVRALRAAPCAAPLRSLRFTPDGGALACGYASGDLHVLDAAGASTWARPASHGGGQAVNVVRPYGPHCLATGDEAGGVRLWDCRARPSAAAPVVFDKQSEVITALACEEGRGALLAACGDGTLGVYDLRKPRLLARTEEGGEEELLALAVVKGGGAVVAGTQGGVLLLWDWGAWAGATPEPERFTGHPESVDVVLALDEDTVLTGSSDGLIRIITLRPNKLVGVLGEHGEDNVERLAWARDKRLLASSSHDDTVRLWDTAYLFEGEEEEEEEGEGGGSAAAAAGGGGGATSRFTRLKEMALPRAGEGEGEEEEEEEEEEEDEDGEGEGEEREEEEEEEEEMDEGKGRKSRHKRKGKAKNSLEASRKKRGGGGAGGGFFKDL